MKVGFTGTRNDLTEVQRVSLEGVLKTLQEAEEFHHGDCKGADWHAALLFHRLYPERTIVAHPGPDGDPWRAHSPFASETREGKNHFARNRDIVDETALLVACPLQDSEQKQGGTWYTVRYARKAGKPIVIVWPSGNRLWSGLVPYHDSWFLG